MVSDGNLCTSLWWILDFFFFFSSMNDIHSKWRISTSTNCTHINEYHVEQWWEKTLSQFSFFFSPRKYVNFTPLIHDIFYFNLILLLCIEWKWVDLFRYVRNAFLLYFSCCDWAAREKQQPEAAWFTENIGLECNKSLCWLDRNNTRSLLRKRKMARKLKIRRQYYLQKVCKTREATINWYPIYA